MDPKPARDATTLLHAHRAGEPGALGELFTLLYDQLRTIAHHRRAGAPRASLDTTAVVHEVYLKLAAHEGLSAEDRGHFLSLSSRAMRQILVDRARRRTAVKRGGGAVHERLEEHHADARAAEMLELDAALERLSATEDRLGRVVELRFFGGLSEDEVAGILGVTDRTVRRDWRRARAFLYEQLYGQESS